MPAVMSQHEDTHLIAHNPEKKVVAKYAQTCEPQVVPEEPEASWIGGDPILSRLHFGEEPIAKLGAAFLVEVF
jgi:hypothetical protein